MEKRKKRRGNSKSKIGNDSVSKRGKFSTVKWFSHAVRPIDVFHHPYNLERVIAACAMVTKEMVSYVNVSREFEGRVIVGQVINGWLVVHVNGNRSAHELSGDVFNDMNEPK